MHKKLFVLAVIGMLVLALAFSATAVLAVEHEGDMSGMDMGGQAQEGQQTQETQQGQEMQGDMPGMNHSEVDLNENQEKSLAGLVALVIAAPVVGWVIFRQFSRRQK